MKIKIAIADDHPLVINGLRHILGNCNDMKISGCYTNGQELLKGIAEQQPDVLLLDIQMPGQTGDELAEIISAQYPAIKILALTNQDNVFYIKSMMRKGASGYILKTTSEEILLDAIRTVHKGGEYMDPILEPKVVQDEVEMREQPVARPVLSRREREVLKFIAMNHTSQQIAEMLFISKRTVDSHRLSLLMKLGAKNVAAMVKKGIQLGLIE